MTELPPMPAAKVIKQAAVTPWLDGFAFLNAAEQEAQARLGRADEITEASRQQGYQAGFEQGAKEASALLISTTAQVNNYVAGLDRQLVELSLSIIAKMLGSFDQAELVAKLAKHALQGFQRERDIIIAVAPDIAPVVGEKLQAEHSNPSINFTVVPDPRLTGAQCILSNAIAVVDASLDTQLAAIREALSRDGTAA